MSGLVVISRKKAKVAGVDRYFTGKSCVNGHTVARKVADGHCTECSRLRNNATSAKRRAEIPDEVNAYARDLYRRDLEANRAKKRAATAKWRDANRELARALDLEAKNAIYATPIGNLNGRMATALRRGLDKGKAGKSWLDLVPYTLDELARHLERQFSKRMSWSNRRLWHIDHIIPLSSFYFTSSDDPEFQAAWALTNLRPLWKEKNMSKGNRRELLI